MSLAKIKSALRVPQKSSTNRKEDADKLYNYCLAFEHLRWRRTTLARFLLTVYVGSAIRAPNSSTSDRTAPVSAQPHEDIAGAAQAQGQREDIAEFTLTLASAS